MVQEAISELVLESQAWRSSLADYRETFIVNQKKLLELASKRLSAEDLKDLEHYQNQFYIQLINIHDVKKDLKQYENVLNYEPATEDEVRVRHDGFKNEFDSLVHVLDGLKTEFEEFMSKPH